MRSAIAIFLLTAGAVCLAAQSPATQPGTTSPAPGTPAGDKATPAAAGTQPVFTSDGGFSFSYPADWEVVDMKPMMPVQRLKAEQEAKSDLERKGADCVEVQLTIRHGDPKSVILIMYLDYKCIGVELKPSDLGGTGVGIAQGLTKSFIVKEPKYGAYSLGKHAFWIERADGSPVDHPESEYKLETACTLLTKGLTCWLAMAASPDAITSFEASNVSLEGDSPVALVPASAFAISK